MPPDPPPLGRVPRGDNPRFPSVGPRAPSPPPGGFQSIIPVGAPIDLPQQRQIANAQQPFQSARRTAGDQSRSGIARALTDSSRTQLGRATDQFNQQYRQQAEKSRSEDTLTQRQNANDQFRLDTFGAVYDKDTNVRYSEGIKDLRQYFETEKRNQQAERAAMVMRFIGGLLGGV